MRNLKHARRRRVTWRFEGDPGFVLDLRTRLENAAAPSEPTPDDVGAPQAFTGELVPGELLHPGGRDSTVWIRYGHNYGKSKIVRDTPETRTPAWWRSRVEGGFRLTLHPAGLEGRPGDGGYGMRTTIDLGAWSGSERLPELPVGEAPAEVVILAPGARVRAHRTAGDPGRPQYVVPGAAWDAAAPVRAAKRAPKVRVEMLNGRVVVCEWAGDAPDAMPKYAERRK